MVIFWFLFLILFLVHKKGLLSSNPRSVAFSFVYCLFLFVHGLLLLVYCLLCFLLLVPVGLLFMTSIHSNNSNINNNEKDNNNNNNNQKIGKL